MILSRLFQIFRWRHQKKRLHRLKAKHKLKCNKIYQVFQTSLIKTAYKQIQISNRFNKLLLKRKFVIIINQNQLKLRIKMVISKKISTLSIQTTIPNARLVQPRVADLQKIKIVESEAQPQKDQYHPELRLSCNIKIRDQVSHHVSFSKLIKVKH